MKKIALYASLLIIGICLVSIVSFLMLRESMENKRYHVYCDLLKPGMNRAEVEEALSSIGSYNKDEDPPYVYIGFTNPFTALTLGQMRLMFEHDNLVGAVRNVSLSDWAVGADCQGDN